ncbi:cupin domain-containing protein [Natronosalvus rutilus]|uniref:Cupin n=1 Tax=Natronosalvus rutilus TaxID=2953753 RepID=A0A9E7NA81_9EURY|nr:cupin [Natronosalvus rutilus]UTF54300.1 cupin [Natronosalvus rutilus]
MQPVELDALDPVEFADGGRRRELSSVLGTTDLAINEYRIPPDGEFPGDLHAHLDQEEVFVVLSGVATFETLSGTVTVAEHEAMRFGRGTFQSGKNGGDAELVVLALGAPRETEDVRVPASCPDCGDEPLRLRTDGKEVAFECPNCGSTFDPDPCPGCGGEDLAFARGADTDGSIESAVVRCRGCEETLEEPPLSERWSSRPTRDDSHK